MDSQDTVESSEISLSQPRGHIQVQRSDKKETEIAPLNTKLRIIKSILLFSTWICMGFWISMPPPCMDVLKDITHSNYEQISIPLAINMIGITVGSLVIGITVDKLEKWFDIVMFLDILVAGLSFAVIPLLSDLILMSLAFFVNGVAAGGWSTASNFHTVSMWGEEAPSPMLLIHMGHSVGTVLGPLLLEPFLPVTKRHYKDNATRKHSNLNDTKDIQLFLPANMYHSDIGNLHQGSNASNYSDVGIHIPYAVAGGYTVVMSVMLLIYFLSSRQHSIRSRPLNSSENGTQTQRGLAESCLPASCTRGNRMFVTVMLILVLLIYLVMLGKDTSVSNFIEPLAVHTPTLNFTMRQADIIVTIHFATYAVGRMMVAFIARCVPITILMFVEASGMIIANVALVIFSLKSRPNFWLTTTAFAFMAGPLFPSGYTWIDRYVPMTGFTYGVLNAGVGLGGFLFQWVAGYIYNYKSHENLLYLSLSCSISLMVLMIVTQCIGTQHGDRYSKEAVVVEVTIEGDTEGTAEDTLLLSNDQCAANEVQ